MSLLQSTTHLQYDLHCCTRSVAPLSVYDGDLSSVALLYAVIELGYEERYGLVKITKHLVSVEPKVSLY